VLADGGVRPPRFHRGKRRKRSTRPSCFDGGGIFLFWQNSEDVALAPDRIIHEIRRATKVSQRQTACHDNL